MDNLQISHEFHETLDQYYTSQWFIVKFIVFCTEYIHIYISTYIHKCIHTWMQLCKHIVI